MCTAFAPPAGTAIFKSLSSSRGGTIPPTNNPSSDSENEVMVAARAPMASSMSTAVDGTAITAADSGVMAVEVRILTAEDETLCARCDPMRGGAKSPR